MSVENSGAVPVPRDDDPVISAGLEIAMKWGAALGGPEQLKVAFEALEPQLKREHQIRLKQLEAQRDAAETKARAEREAAEHRARTERETRQHRFRMTSLVVGAVMSIAMLGAGVYVAKDVWWLAMVLCGPSLIAILKIIVLRRSDPSDMAAVAAAARGATNAASQAQPPV
ncbi:hypothetical protein ACIBAG_10560 [Streptomyces sp. NPDC051243]|uniref:hypothetical protein n=1 Tax=Streptomyces sp. NPDC051243 TaxID=3365646 RepID=UPI00378CB26A